MSMQPLFIYMTPKNVVGLPKVSQKQTLNQVKYKRQLGSYTDTGLKAKEQKYVFNFKVWDIQRWG